MGGKEDSKGITVRASFDKSSLKKEIVLWLNHCVFPAVDVYISSLQTQICAYLFLVVSVFLSVTVCL